MTSAMIFSYGTYLAMLLCILFCIREWLASGWIHGLIQLATLIGFCVIYWLVESWAGIRAPFYDYLPPDWFPHEVPRADLSSSLGAFFGPGAAAQSSTCALVPRDALPLAIPVAGGCISFAVLWTVRLLMDSKGFVYEPFLPLWAPWIVGLMTLWLDLALDPVLADSLDCQTLPQLTHAGLSFWTWSADADLIDIWFHVPIYNFAVWYAAPAILTALVILMMWLYLKLTGVSVSAVDGAARALILFFVGVILFVSPNVANSTPEVILLVVTVVAVGMIALIARWETFRRSNPWRWELIATLTFFFLFPAAGLLFSEHFRPITAHIWLLLITLLVAIWGVFFAISPYWRRQTAGPSAARVVVAIAVSTVLLGYLGNS